MDHERLLSELLGAARKLGLRVRIEPFDAASPNAGGVCKLEGRHLVLIDARAGTMDQALALARALSGFDHESVYLAPEARRYIHAESKVRRMNR